MSRIRIKFCGFTRPEDVDAAVLLGVDAIGLVLVPQSRRGLAIEAAVALRRRLPPFVSAVLLFQNAAAGFVRDAVRVVEPDLLQFHGDESAEYCASFGRPYLIAAAMGRPETGGSTPAAICAAHPAAAGLLVDGHAPGALGGSGQAFDWSRLPKGLPLPVILAGGLRPDNVAAAVQAVRPYAVDVSSGIESAPGCKEFAKMQAFIEEVQRASSS